MARKHVATLMALIVVTMMLMIPAGMAKGGQEKQELCHNGHTIEVGARAVEAHLSHGDEPGPCGPPDDCAECEKEDEGKPGRR